MTKIFPSDGPFFSRIRCVAFVNRTLRIGPKTFVPLLEIVTESGGSVSCDTQLNCRALFTIATALLSSPFFGFLLGCSSTCAELTSRFRLIKLTFGRMPTVTRWFSASTFQEVPARLSIGLPRRTPASEGPSFFSTNFYLLVLVAQRLERVFGVDFARSWLSCRKLHWSPLEHCPFSLHL